MKNKKSIFAIVLVVMVLVLGIGYAIVNGTQLSITGTASTEESTMDVVISDVDLKDSTQAVYGTVNNPADKTATIYVSGLKEVGESKTLTYTISNKEKDLDASVIKSSITNSKSEFFEVTTSIDSTPITVKANGTNTMTVTVKLIKMPIESTDSTTDIEIKLDATPTEKSSS